jgi:16S rRNA (uracil1498-N3)-methyltransferase
MNLILLEQEEVTGDGTVALSDARAHHLLDVLKVVPGHVVRVGVIDGGSGIATVSSTTGRTLVLRCQVDSSLPPRPPVDLLLALPRPKVLRRLWAQLAALGVGQIILTNAGRVERNYFDTHVLMPDCYRPLLIEGLQQARDTRLPQVSIHKQFKVLVEDHLDALFATGFRVVADPGCKTRLGDVVGQHPGERVLLAVGPEGGWNDFELKLLTAHRFYAAGMGARTLRSDTACVALLTLVHDALRRAYNPGHD